MPFSSFRKGKKKTAKNFLITILFEKLILILKIYFKLTTHLFRVFYREKKNKKYKLIDQWIAPRKVWCAWGIIFSKCLNNVCKCIVVIFVSCVLFKTYLWYIFILNVLTVSCWRLEIMKIQFKNKTKQFFNSVYFYLDKKK